MAHGIRRTISTLSGPALRPIIQLSQVDGRLLYFFRNTDGSGPIVYREITDNGNGISAGAETILLNGDSVVPGAISTISRVRKPDSLTT